MSAKAIEESDVGISCYITQTIGFRGILKQRYYDFIVNEVDGEGNVVHLTSMEAPPEEMEEDKTENTAHSDKCYLPEIEYFKELCCDSDVASLKLLIDQINSGYEVSIPPIILSPSSDKAHRTKVHNFFKEKLKFLVTDTVDGPDTSSKCIRVRFNVKQGRNGHRKRKGEVEKPFDDRCLDSWPKDLGKFLSFHLYKENKDTQEAFRVIGQMLGIHTKSFGFAGTKDKRSVSTQRVTVFKQRATRLAALNDRLIGIKVGDFRYAKAGLLLGQLQGNRFAVTLRGVDAASMDAIRESTAELGRNGFINYFGLQRFGSSSSVPTHLIGAYLLRGEWSAAVNFILGPREGEKDVIRKVREYFKESNDVEGTLRQLPKNMTAERAILQSLRKYPEDYLQALKSVPRTLRMMYVHSYQSYLWNHAASWRVKKHGSDRVVLGDLVLCKRERDAQSFSDHCFDDPNDDCNFDESSLSEENKNLVKVICSEDLTSELFSIDDIVLPLPGSRVIYPENEIASVYEDLSKKDNINLEESVHGVKEFSITSMTGDYRRVFQKLKDFEWEVVSYFSTDEPLAKTDLDRIQKGKAGGCFEMAKSKDEGETAEGNTVSDMDTALNSQMAVKLAFTLPASSYATMAIRELLKSSTSAAYHRMLN